MKLKNILVVILVLIASSMSLYFTGCKGVYDDVFVLVQAEKDDKGELNLVYDYDDVNDTYTLQGSNEIIVKIHKLDDDMLAGISYSLTNTKSLCQIAWQRLYIIRTLSFYI